MNLKSLFKTIVLTGVFWGAAGIGAANPVISADLTKTQYSVGDVVTLRINVAQNTGFHGVHFDLGYDGNVLAFDSLVEDAIPRAVNRYQAGGGQLLFAVSDPQTSGIRGQHLVVSYSLAAAGAETKVNGVLAEIKFRVIGRGAPGAPFQFTFKSPGSSGYGANQAVLTGVQFRDSPQFTISTTDAPYVQITAPLTNYVHYADTLALSAISTAGTGLTYRVTNGSAYFSSDPLSAVSGSLTSFSVPLAFGPNKIQIELVADNKAVATDSIVIHRAEDEVFVKIISPLDHALVNTDRVEFLVTSPLETVTVNGQPTVKLAEKFEGKNLFSAKLWLKKGFNTVIARTVGPDSQIFTNAIDVYYQKDDAVFQWVTPLAGAVIKADPQDPNLVNGSLKVRGEIGSLEQSSGVSNTVTLRVIYRPKNTLLPSRVLVQDRLLSTAESTVSGGLSQAPYMFFNDFEIPVAELESGELELIAFKNKQGSIAESVIHRVLYIDKSRLAISLVQPNISGTDVLDTKVKVKGFNRAADPAWGALDLQAGGVLGLTPSNAEVREQLRFQGKSVADFLETKDGSRYALVNENQTMALYRWNPKTGSWDSNPVMTSSALFGYTLAETDVGILIGGSNLFLSDNSGLYLYSNATLKNITIGEPLAHVQFIENRDGVIYLYGNDYSHLYSFNVFSLEESGARLRAGEVKKVSFSNDLFIRQFVLNHDATMALILDNDGRVSVHQNRSGSGFSAVSFDAAVLSSESRFSQIVAGEYSQGSYHAYVLMAKSTASPSVQVLMENTTSHRLIMNTLNSQDQGLLVPGETLLGLTFRDDRYWALYKKPSETGFSYTLRKATILFNQLSFEAGTSNPVFESTLNLNPGAEARYGLQAFKDGSFLWGYQPGLTPSALYDFVHTYPDSGAVAFDYDNRDAEALYGFSFLVDPSWIQSEEISLAFGVTDRATGQLITGTPEFSPSTRLWTLKEFLALKSALFQVSREYDSELAQEVVRVELTNPEANQLLSFAFQLKPVGTSPRFISNLSISKKVSVRIPRSPGDTILLPIQGWVEDPTVKEIRIQEKTVALETGGYFSLNYELSTAVPQTTITLTAYNAAGERTTLSFRVEIFESVNAIDQVVFREVEGTTTTTLPGGGTDLNQFETDQELLRVSAEFFGLEGAVVGYESFAYTTTDGVATLERIDGAVFEPIRDVPTNPIYTNQYGAGYVSGRIVNATIPLYPGKQRVVVYVENPGGKRSEYKINGLYPDVTYNLSNENQKILLLNPGIAPLSVPQVVQSVSIADGLEVVVSEVETVSGTTKTHQFKKTVTLSGRINSLYRFTDLKVKSLAPTAVFSNGSTEAVIAVDQLSRFEVEVSILLPEEGEEFQIPLLLIPTAPFLEWMKTGILLQVKKDYRDSYYVPNFDLMESEHWTSEERQTFKKTLRVRFNRPLPRGTSLGLSVNFETPITGVLVEEGVGTQIYRLIDGERNEMVLAGLKSGQNRLRWELSRNVSMASSVSGREGMSDYLLPLDFSGVYVPTAVSFPVEAKAYYDSNSNSGDGGKTIPDLVITKQESTKIKVYINGELLPVTSDGLAVITVPVKTLSLVQGRNTVSVRYDEEAGNSDTVHFAFFFDTLPPSIQLFDSTVGKDPQGELFLETLSVLIREANLKTVVLMNHQELGNSEVTASYELTDIGDQTYRITWPNLGNLVPKLRPTSDFYLYVEATDYTQKTAKSADFTGVTQFAAPQSVQPSLVPVSEAQAYRGEAGGDLPLMHESELWPDAPFSKRVKIYSSDIEIDRLAIDRDEDFRVARPGKITLESVTGLQEGRTLTLSANGGVEFKPGFSFPLGRTLSVPDPTTLTNPKAPVVTLNHQTASNEVGFSFWFRYEPEPYYSSRLQTVHRILTLSQGTLGTGTELTDYAVFVGYQDLDKTRLGEERLVLAEWQGTRVMDGQTWTGAWQNEQTVVLNDDLVLEKGGATGWNLVTASVSRLIIDQTEQLPVFRLSVNQQTPVEVNLVSTFEAGPSFVSRNDSLITSDPWAYLIGVSQQALNAGAVYHFGNWDGSSADRPDRTAENGQFSIAQPFWINKAITNVDVLNMTGTLSAIFAAGQETYQTSPDLRGAVYHFGYRSEQGRGEQVGAGYLELRTQGTAADYSSRLENAAYSQTTQGTLVPGSLRATGLRLNRLKTLENGSLVFADARSPVTDKLKVTNGAGANDGWLVLTPETSLYAGRYSFANNFGAHSIEADRWYSIQGKVESLNSTAALDATLVVVLNRVERRYPLVSGEFHFLFPNEGVQPVSTAVMYIETKSELRLSKTMFFVEGNQHLPDEAFGGLKESAASTTYLFQKQGTVEFWYKPLGTSPEGFLDRTVVLADSEFFKIEAVSELHGHAVYRASLRGTLESELGTTVVTTKALSTNVPVQAGWQHLQLSWDHSRGVAYFFVNGKLVASVEGESLPLSPTMRDRMPDADNLFLGQDAAKSRFASGYLDELRLDNFYSLARFVANSPVEISYTDGYDPEDAAEIVPNPVLRIERSATLTGNIDDLWLRLENSEGQVVYQTFDESIGALALKITDYEAGQYKLSIRALVNGARFEQVFRFVKNDRPRFVLKGHTALIVKDDPTNVQFSFRYDTSGLLDKHLVPFAGLALEVKGQLNSTPFTKTYYVVQDFLDFSHNDRWLIYTPNNGDIYQDLVVADQQFLIEIPGLKSSVPLQWSYRPFYFKNQFSTTAVPPGAVSQDNQGQIGLAGLSFRHETTVLGGKSYDYKLGVFLGTEGALSSAGNSEFALTYKVTAADGRVLTLAAPVSFSTNGQIDLFYDDMMKGLGYGKFTAVISLVYKNSGIASYTELLDWNQIVSEETTVIRDKRLTITELSLLRINKQASAEQADLYLAYDQSGFYSEVPEESTDLLYDLSVSRENSNGSFTEVTLWQGRKLPLSQDYTLISGVPLPDLKSLVRVKVYEAGVGGLSHQQDLTIISQANPPTVVLTNSVESRIGYNNVRFTWIGYQDDTFKPELGYSYNFDGQGWSSISPAWRSAELYNLAEGYHNFRVRAHDGDRNTSPEAVATFFVDIRRPVIDLTKITVDKVFDDAGFLYAVTLKGAAGALADISLDGLLVNGTPVTFRSDGSFIASGLPITIDGDNPITLMATDKVGNFTEAVVHVDNTLTEILYPLTGSVVRYAPVTVVGRLPSKLNSLVDLYLKDSQTPATSEGSHDGWRQARVNEDFTFFIEDVRVHPGTAARAAVTNLEMAIVTKSGRVYTKSLNVYTNEVVMPIDLTLSTHSVEGENTETRVTIRAAAKVSDISSWSIDFTGDGIYDDTFIADSPALSQTKEWVHTYSTLGLVTPRVRVITRSGQVFSVADKLIIHESIREASNKAITSPLALSALTMEDQSQRLFVLAGENGAYRVEVYEIGRNETYVSNKLFQISLVGMGIDNPVKIVALDAQTLVIAENRQGTGILHTLKADEFDVFSPVLTAEVHQSEEISDVSADENQLFVSLMTSSAILTVDLANGLPVPSTLKRNEPAIENERPLGTHASLAKDASGILVADYFRQRVLRLSSQFTALEYRGTQGWGEGEFIKPSTVRSYQNRIFVYDEGREDVQVFDPDFQPIANLKYTVGSPTNYFDAEFLKGVKGISVFTREEGNRLFYYAVLLSRTSQKLAVLRMPQWEEMRARVRNNKIIFLKDNEVYSAKPNGSDLARLISSDSLPRTNGSVDYPTLSPDGKMLAFTSRAKLYDGSGQTITANTYAYDNLYMMNTDGTNLTRIPLSAVQGYEIERPQFNSNGTKLIFSAKPTGGTWQIFVYTLETGSVVRLFTSDENARFPYYSPDDRFIAFTTDYDGDEDIHIFDTLNPSVRVTLTNNRARDSFPVWSVVYPGEIANPDLKIESKIAFVSDRSAHKGVYYVYLSRPSESDLRVVKKTGEQVGSQPDQAAIELTTLTTEGDYPAFTGDGTAVVFEHFDGTADTLLRYDFAANTSAAIGLMNGTRRPAGMKNTIAQFKTEIVNGNDVRLTWSRYTEADVFYTVRFKVNTDNTPYVEKRVFTQGETTLTGLDMGVEYLFKVSIEENGEEAASTQWKKALVPEVAARPSFTIDETNPYLVHLKAWKPQEDTDWGFTWIIDNQEVQAQSSQDYLFEFGTSGSKTIVLKARNKANTYTSVSGPMTVNIVSDIRPAVEYVLAEDRSYVELSAQRSLGSRIDWSTALWTVTGPGLSTTQTVVGSRAIVNTSGFKNKINVNLRVARIPVLGQASTDTLETNLVIDLDYTGTKLVITQATNEAESRLITFSGANSIGNVNWREARWTIFRDGQSLYQTTGVSSFAYEFPETGVEARYTVTLSVPQLSDGATATVSNLVSVTAAPMEPVIDYEIVELKNAQGVVQGAKVLFSAGNSKGNNIDFAQTKWTVPVAGTYGEQPTQIGPTAVYNLFNVGSTSQVEVSLTLMRRGSAEALTVTKMIYVKGGQLAKPELIVERSLKTTSTGKTVELTVLKSTGPNIDWERTTWQFSATGTGVNQSLTQAGPTARIDLPASAEDAVLRYTVTLYLLGNSQPLVKNEELRLGASTIKPILTVTKLPGGSNNVFTFAVTDTQGVNIDWERTTWSFYDGNETVTQKYGAQATHAFVKKAALMGYPVMVAMYFKNNAKPFYGYTSVDVEGDALTPVIKWDNADATAGSEILFTADGSTGSGIDWSQAKWTFGDGSPSQYGPAVGHKYAYSTNGESYKVSLTLTRRLSTGETETATQYTSVQIGKDEITPVVKAQYNQRTGLLLVDATESLGRGLLLDRSVWNFQGKGDTETSSETKTVGTTETRKWGAGVSVNMSTASLLTPISISSYLSADFGGGRESSDTISTGTAYTNENYHTGIGARRFVWGKTSVSVMLSVYRQDADGKLVGETISVNISLTEAAKSGGVTYR